MKGSAIACETLILSIRAENKVPHRLPATRKKTLATWSL